MTAFLPSWRQVRSIKKIFYVLVLFAAALGMVLFSACGKGDGGGSYPPKPPERFETDLSLTAGDEEIKAHLTYHGFGNCTLNFTFPENLQGLSAVWREDKCILSYNNLSYTVKLDKLPEGFFGKAALSVFDKLVDVESFTVVREEDKWVYKGDISSGSFRLAQNGESGAFETLEIPEMDILLKFENFKEIKEE